MDENINGVSPELPTPSATGEQTGLEETSDLVESKEIQIEAGQERQAETEVKPEPKHFREGYEALERDVKQYKPIADAVNELGGLEVIKALKPLADMALDESIDPDIVVKTLQETLLPQHLEAVAWAAIDNPESQAALLADPDIRQVISDRLFNGRSIEDVQAALEVLAEEDVDPETLRLRQELNQFKSQQQQIKEQQEFSASQGRVNELQKRFFMDTADEVVKQLNMVAPVGATDEDKKLFEDTIVDMRYAAQGRFLTENQDAYLQIQDMYAKGFVTQARVSEARLHNKWQATLIKTAERASKQLQSRIETVKNAQQARTQNIRPDVTGNTPKSEVKGQERYDLNDPNCLNNFLEEFKREAANA